MATLLVDRKDRRQLRVNLRSIRREIGVVEAIREQVALESEQQELVAGADLAEPSARYLRSGPVFGGW